MPLTKKGKKIMHSMKKSYGTKKGEQVFYASQNKGTIAGTHHTGKGTRARVNRAAERMLSS